MLHLLCEAARTWLQAVQRMHRPIATERRRTHTRPAQRLVAMTARKALGCGICGKPVHGRGYCAAHYRRWRLYGSAYGGKRVNWQPVECTVAQCRRRARLHNMCSAHAIRLQRTGDVRADVPIRERSGKTQTRCGATGCERQSVAKSYCAAHLYRRNRFGDALAHVPIGDLAIRNVKTI